MMISFVFKLHELLMSLKVYCNSDVKCLSCKGLFRNQTGYSNRIFQKTLSRFFDAILTGRQSGQKLQCSSGNPMAKKIPTLNFTRFVNQKY